jgi:ubiquitin C-terminal hydrolase
MEYDDGDAPSFDLTSSCLLPGAISLASKWVSGEFANSDASLTFSMGPADPGSPLTIGLQFDEISSPFTVQATVTCTNSKTRVTDALIQTILLSDSASSAEFTFSGSIADYVLADISIEFGFSIRTASAHLGMAPLAPATPPLPYFPVGDGRDSKEKTGFVGLQNQGATCYMNSMLQSLFHVPAFRRLVYAIPTSGNEDEETNIPLNLQRLFCEMQLSDRPCSTTALTTSFGWGDQDTFVQHDVQEFCRVLLGNIEGKLKGTDLEHSIADLFRARLRNYRRCPNCPVNFSRDEEFYDLSMLVRGCSNLQESFEKYIEKEKLAGDNQYGTDDYGLQDMEMGHEFLDFPKVLHIHLRRFDFDVAAEAQMKIHDFFEFPEEIDLRSFVVDKSSPSLFHLYGVLVHSGTAMFGHYYAYLRPSTSPNWFEFDDQLVSPAKRDDAVSKNFGGTIRSAATSSSMSGRMLKMASSGQSQTTRSRHTSAIGSSGVRQSWRTKTALRIRSL